MATSGSGTSSAASFGSGFRTLAEIVSRARRMADDTTIPYLWSDDEFTEIIDDIQKELCATLPIIEDRETPDLCEIALVQNNAAITLDPRITTIKLAQLDSQTQPLDLVHVDYLNYINPSWRTADAGVPQYLVNEGLGTGVAQLHPKLLAATDTLRLTVHRLPLETLSYAAHSSARLDIDNYSHMIMHGILAMAYAKHDTDTDNERKAERHRVLWEGKDGRGGDKERIKRMVLRSTLRPETAAPMMACM